MLSFWDHKDTAKTLLCKKKLHFYCPAYTSFRLCFFSVSLYAMDVAELSKLIGDLLLDNDKVGLPGLGTFVSEAAPATFSDKGYTINPPYRRLSFTSECLEDQILAENYASSVDIDTSVAKSFLTAFISGLGDILADRRTVTFPGLGRLRCTNRDELFFVADEDLDIFPDGFGLEPVSLKTHHETDEDVSIAVSDLAEFIKNQPVPQPGPEVPEEDIPQEKATEIPAATVPEIQIPAGPAPAESFPAEPAPVPVYHMPKRRPRKWLIWLLAIAGLVVLFIAIFLLLVHLAPDFIDSILYTEEELRIINY